MDPVEEQAARLTLGKTLKGLREQANYTQLRFAEAINYSRSTVANVETARQRVPREFWIACDALLQTGSLLTNIHDRLVAARSALQRLAAERELAGVAELSTDEASPDPKAVGAAPTGHAVHVDRVAHDILATATRASLVLSRSAISDVFDDLAQLAIRYGHQHRMTTFLQGQESVEGLLLLREEATSRSDVMDVNLATCLTSALMASAAFDLSRQTAAMSLARAARTFAEQSGNPSAIAWSHGLIASFLNWQSRPAQALVAIDQGLKAKPGPAARYRLLHVAARSHAQQGNQSGTRDALDEAARVGSSLEAGDLLNDELGGEFRFDAERAAACEGAAWLDLGQGAVAVPALRSAITSYVDVSGTSQPAAPLYGAQIDLASAYVLSDDLDAAVATMQAMDPPAGHHHISVISARRASLRRRLLASRWCHTRQASALAESLSGWRTAEPGSSQL